MQSQLEAVIDRSSDAEIRMMWDLIEEEETLRDLVALVAEEGTATDLQARNNWYIVTGELVVNARTRVL